MLIIITVIITQGPRVPSDLKGDLKGSFFIRGGVLEAIGIISFGEEEYSKPEEMIS